VSLVKNNSETDWTEWVQRITARDPDSETELVRRYQNGITLIIRRIVNNESVTKDISQETFKIALEKIRDGDLRDPEKLSGFISSVARNLAKAYMRKMRRSTSQEEIDMAERIQDPRPDQFEELWRKERAKLVLQTIYELKIERDREVLYRYYIAEEDKAHICADLGLTSQQFNSVISRALKRYKELYLKRLSKL